MTGAMWLLAELMASAGLLVAGFGVFAASVALGRHVTLSHMRSERSTDRLYLQVHELSKRVAELEGEGTP